MGVVNATRLEGSESMDVAVLGQMRGRRVSDFDEAVEPVIQWLDSGCPPCKQVRPIRRTLVLSLVLICVAAVAGFTLVDLNKQHVGKALVDQFMDERAILEQVR